MSLINLFVTAVSAWVALRKRRRAYDELVAFDDRLLADIGVLRTDTLGIFNERFRREGVGAQGAGMAPSALPLMLVFGGRGLPPIWPQL